MEEIQRRLWITFTLCRGFTTVPVEDWNCDGKHSSSRLGARQERRSRQIMSSPSSRSGTLRIHACGDCAPCADCRRKPTLREKACRGNRKPHPQRSRQAEQGGVVHPRLPRRLGMSDLCRCGTVGVGLEPYPMGAEAARERMRHVLSLIDDELFVLSPLMRAVEIDLDHD